LRRCFAWGTFLNLTLTLACPSLPSLPTTTRIVDLANIDTSPESAYH